MHICPHRLADRPQVRQGAYPLILVDVAPENDNCYERPNSELFVPSLYPLPNAAYAQASGEGGGPLTAGGWSKSCCEDLMVGRLSSSAQLTKLLQETENFLEAARTSPLCFSWPTSWSWEAFWFFFLWLVMWWTDSDSRIRPASLSSSEANSKSSLPTCSQVKSTDWEEACERALITVLPIVPAC